MKFTYGDLDPTAKSEVDTAWAAASQSLNSDSLDFPSGERDFKDGYNFAEHNGAYHFDGEKGAGKDTYQRVLELHEMWNQSANMPDSAARVLGMLAAVNAMTGNQEGVA